MSDRAGCTILCWIIPFVLQKLALSGSTVFIAAGASHLHHGNDTGLDSSLALVAGPGVGSLHCTTWCRSGLFEE